MARVSRPLAAPSLFEGRQFRKAKLAGTAGTTYLAVTDAYPKHKLAAEAASGRAVYEQMAYSTAPPRPTSWWSELPTRTSSAAPTPCSSLAVRCARRWPDEAPHFELYSKKFKDRKAEVAS